MQLARRMDAVSCDQGRPPFRPSASLRAGDRMTSGFRRDSTGLPASRCAGGQLSFLSARAGHAALLCVLPARGWASVHTLRGSRTPPILPPQARLHDGHGQPAGFLHPGPAPAVDDSRAWRQPAAVGRRAGQGAAGLRRPPRLVHTPTPARRRGERRLPQVDDAGKRPAPAAAGPGGGCGGAGAARRAGLGGAEQPAASRRVVPRSRRRIGSRARGRAATGFGGGHDLRGE